MCITFACVLTCMCKQAHSTGMCGSKDAFLNCFSLSLQTAVWVTLAVQGFPRVPPRLCLSSSYKGIGTHCNTGFYMIARHLNSGSQA